MLIHNKDDIELVTEFPCFLGTLQIYLKYGFVPEFLEIAACIPDCPADIIID